MNCRGWAPIVLGLMMFAPWEALSELDSSQSNVISLEMSEAIAIAVGANLSIQVAALSPEEAALGLKVAQGIYDPSFTAGLSNAQTAYGCSSDQECSEGERLLFQSSLRLGLGLSQRTPIGGTIAVSGELNRTTNTADNYIFPGWRTSADVTVVQPLLRGGGYRINRLDIQRALLEQDLSWQVLRGQVQELIVSVHGKYWALLFAQKGLELGEQSLEFARKQGDITQERIELGFEAPVAIFAVEQTIASREADVVFAHNRVRTAEVQLRELLVWPIIGDGADRRILPVDAPPELEATMDQSIIHGEAMAQDPTLKRLKRLVDIRETEENAARNRILPTLNFSGAIGVAGVIQDDVDRSLGEDLSPAWRAGLNLQSDVGWRVARSAYSQAKINTTKAELAMAQREQTLAVAVDQAVNAVNTAKVRVDLSAKARRLADMTLDAERERLARGESTLKNVLDYLTIRDQSRLTELQSRIDLASALLSVEALRGTLVPQFDIDLKDVGQGSIEENMGG